MSFPCGTPSSRTIFSITPAWPCSRWRRGGGRNAGTDHPAAQHFGYAGLGLMLVVLAAMTYRQTSVYVAAETSTAIRSPRTPRVGSPRIISARLCAITGRIHEAISHWRTAVAIAPGEPELPQQSGGGIDLARANGRSGGTVREALRLLPNFAAPQQPGHRLVRAASIR